MTEKAKDFKGSIKNLFKYMSAYRTSLILVIVFAICSAIFSIVGPKILGNATTEIFNGLVSKINGTGSGIDFTNLGSILITLVGLYVISMIFSFMQSFIMSGISQKLSYRLRKDISLKINKLPMKYFETRTTGEILSRITNDVDNVSQNLNQSMTQVITSITTVIGVLVMMLTISIPLTLASMLILPLSLFGITFIVGKSQKHFKNQQAYLGNINGNIEESYSGHSIVRVFNKEKETIDDFNKINDKLYDSSWKSQFLSGMMMPIMTFIGNLGYVVISIYGGYLVIINKIEIGSILSFTQYIRTFTYPIAQAAQVANLMQSIAASFERVEEFLNEEEEIDNVSNKKLNSIEKNITFNHVKFGYNTDKIIIKDFNIEIKKGQKIAIVGPTGAGKTTIVKLLMRFYDVTEGSILIDNVNVKDISRNNLRNLFGMVLQDTWLFNGTICNNIKYSKLDASDEEVISAAKAARVDHFVKTLPDGYNMIINEETNNISQGQKQLMTIARVILKDPEILILDEATSSVDTRTEVLIQEAMDNLMEGRTSFIIAHRLSTIKNADIILVMDQGDIVEIGNHEELLEKNGFYSKLYNSQFEEVSE
ncbi:MAG: ABC transporter ATP-binding protein [Bacilli bacterium]|nr:ABC transporter ATP-binding protein [Bacilli bacterium]